MGRSGEGRFEVDAEKFRAYVRDLDRPQLLSAVYLALERLPEETWPELLEAPREWDPVRRTAPRPSLLEEVEAFHAAVLRREYHVEFQWTSQTYDHLSTGTQGFVVEFERLVRRTLEREREGGHTVARVCLERLLDLVQRIDDDRQELLFYAHAAGSEAIGLEVEEVLLAYLRCLAATADAREFAQAVWVVVDDLELCRDTRERWLRRAARVATEEQREELRRRGLSGG